MADGVKVGEGYIEVRPELDEAALVAKRAELERAMASSYDRINKDALRKLQARIQSQLAFEKSANNSVLQASSALERQRQAAVASAEDGIRKERDKTFKDGLTALEFRKKVEAQAEAERVKVTKATEKERLAAIKASGKEEVAHRTRTASEMTRAFEVEVRKQQDIIDRESKRSGRGGNFFASLGGPTVVNALQGAAAVGIIGTITPLTGAIVGLASAFAVAGTATAAFGIAAVGHLAQVRQAIQQVHDKGVSLSDLPADFSRLLPVVDRFRGSWNQFLNDTRRPVFDVFARGLDVAGAGLTELTPVVNAAAGGFSHALSIVEQFVSGPAVTGFLSIVRQQAPGAIEGLTRSATNLGSGLLRIFSGFAPAGQAMLHVIERLTQQFADWAQKVSASTGFQQFVSYAAQYGPKVVETLVNIGVAIGKIIVGLGPLAAAFLTALDVVSRLLASMSPGTWETISVAILAVVVAMKGWAVIQAVIGGFKTLQVVLGTTAIIMGTTSAAAVILRTALVALTAATVVGLLITALVAGLSSMTSVSGSAAAATGVLTTQQQELADALRQSNGALDENVRKVAAKRLQDQGVLDAAQSVGVSPKALTDAYLQGGTAWQSVIDKMVARRKDLESQISEALKHGGSSATTDALQKQREALTAAINAAKEDTGAFAAAQAATQQFNDAVGGTSQALDLTTTAFDRYTAAKQAALGLATPEGQIASDVATAYTNLQRAVRSTTESRYAESQAAKQAASANAQAARQIQDALYSEVQARNATKQAVLSLTQAREDAARKLRDEAGVEGSAKVALERAQREAAALGLFKGPLVSEEDIKKQEALLNLTSAQNAYTDAQKQGELLIKQGIEGNPSVVAAKQALADAIRSEARSHQAVTDAYRNQTETIANGEHARAVAHQSTLDATAAQKDAQAAYDASKKALDASGDSAKVASDKMQGLRDELSKSLSMDTGDAQRQLSDVMRYITAIKLLAANPDMDWATAWAQAGAGPKPQIGGTPQQAKNDKEFAKRFISGGFTGPGGKYEPAGIVHAGEWVATKEMVDANGGPAGFGALMSMLPGYAGGGPVIKGRGITPGQGLTSHGVIQKALSGLGYGGTDLGGSSAGVGQVQNWLRGIASDPYVLGAVGPYAHDCSGLVGEVWARLTGHPNYQRYFVTGNEEQFLRGAGFKPGVGAFTVGFSDSHTAGNLAGLGFEAANSTAGLHIGSGARDVRTFPHTYYLPQLGNRFVGSAGRAVNLPGLLGFPGGQYLAPLPPAGELGGSGDFGSAILDDWISQASRYTNIPGSWIAGIKTIIQRESGGNPRAINLTDSNALAGDPSKGLMQVIHSTFERYRSRALPDDQFNPVSNIVAAVNYIRSRYGSIFNVQQANPNLPPRGYKNGGVMMPGDLGLNETREPEFVFNKDQLGEIGGHTTVKVLFNDDRLKDLIRIEIEEDSNNTELSLRGGHGRKG